MQEFDLTSELISELRIVHCKERDMLIIKLIPLFFLMGEIAEQLAS